LAYLVRWGCFIMDESLTPAEAAQAARERSLDENNQAWHVVDLETDECTVVNLKDGDVLWARPEGDNWGTESGEHVA
jgi:hypothetical protein